MFRILIIVTLAASQMSSAQSLGWQSEIVDSSGAGKASSLRVDRYGNVHVAFVSDGDNSLKYSFWDHALKRWFTMNVAKDASYCSMVLDSLQRPHIAYADYGTAIGSKLRYAHWDGANWTIEAIPVNSEVIAYYTSIALDAADRPSITFYEYRGPKGTDIVDRLRIVSWNGNVWQVRTIDAENQSGKFNSLAIDSQENIHVAYANVGAMTAGMRYAFWNGNVWVTEVIEGFKQNGGATVGYSACIALDDNGTPHVAYMNVSEPGLKYAVRRNDKWLIESVDTVAGVGYPDRDSIAIHDSAPYISYYDSGRGYLKLAHKEGSRWYSETVDKNGAGFTSSLQVNKDGIWISYADEGGGGLKVAHRLFTPRETIGASSSLGKHLQALQTVGR